MKHDINLYHVSLRPVQELLDTRRFLIALVLTAFIGIVFSLVQGQAVKNAEAENIKLAENNQKLLAQMTDFKKRLNQYTVKPSLVDQVRKAETDVKTRRQLLAEFEQRGRVHKVNLSPVLYELSTVHVEGLWLDKIRIEPAGVLLQGKTNRGVHIPRWMAHFKDREILGSHDFALVNLDRDKDNVLTFAIRTEEKEDAGIRFDTSVFDEIRNRTSVDYRTISELLEETDSEQ